jgi:hypothetical protein
MKNTSTSSVLFHLPPRQYYSSSLFSSRFHFASSFRMTFILHKEILEEPRHILCEPSNKIVLPAAWKIIFWVGYLTVLSVLRLHRVDKMIINDYEAVGGMIIGRRNRRTRRQISSVPLCPLQISYYLTWDRTRIRDVGSRQLTKECWNRSKQGANI